MKAILFVSTPREKGKMKVALQEHSSQAEHTGTNDWGRSPDGKAA
jgi:hypothetical protein